MLGSYGAQAFPSVDVRIVALYLALYSQMTSIFEASTERSKSALSHWFGSSEAAHQQVAGSLSNALSGVLPLEVSEEEAVILSSNSAPERSGSGVRVPTGWRP